MPANARNLIARALHIRQSIYGPRHPWTATCIARLGQALAELGQLTAARHLLEHSLDIRESVYGPDDHTVTFSLNPLGVLLAEM
jgi:hypothetical protein